MQVGPRGDWSAPFPAEFRDDKVRRLRMQLGPRRGWFTPVRGIVDDT